MSGRDRRDAAATAHDGDGDGPIVQVEDVHVSFGKTKVLRGVTFDLERGKTLCILGGSGGGRSTLLKAMIGEIPPEQGHIRIDGHEICGVTPAELDAVRRRTIGVMFQSGALLNSLTVAENVALPISYHSSHEKETIDTMVKIKLQQVDLLHAADKRPSEISGGMTKRAAIARALAMDPPVLFYDEPSAGLDPIATNRIDQLIIRLRDSMHMTNVVVTHELESVKRIADRIVMLHEGEVALDGTWDDLMTSDDPRVEQFRSGDLRGPAGGQTSVDDYLEDLLL